MYDYDLFMDESSVETIEFLTNEAPSFDLVERIIYGEDVFYDPFE